MSPKRYDPAVDHEPLPLTIPDRGGVQRAGQVPQQHPVNRVRLLPRPHRRRPRAQDRTRPPGQAPRLALAPDQDLRRRPHRLRQLRPAGLHQPVAGHAPRAVHVRRWGSGMTVALPKHAVSQPVSYARYERIETAPKGASTPLRGLTHSSDLGREGLAHMIAAYLHDPDVLSRFWTKVAIGAPDECWEWQASGDPLGYGIFCLPRNGGQARRIKAHRFALGTRLGESVAEHLVTDHLCRNPPCCNPTHLEAVTQAENLRRSPLQREPGEMAPCGAWQRAKTHCPQNHPYDEANTGIRPNGHRYCRACARERMRRRAGIHDDTGRAIWATA